MNREVVEIFSEISQKLSFAKNYLGDLRESNLEVYSKVREELADCQELMAKYCDCAPIKLIAGQVDDIIANYRSGQTSGQQF